MPGRPEFSQRAARDLGVYWYWLTMLGVLAVGVDEVLPALYAGPGDTYLLGHQIFCCVAWLEMTLNWLCVRLISSAFRPQEHVVYIMAHANEIRNSGYEINLNQLKPQNATEGKFSIPVNGVKTKNGHTVSGIQQQAPKTIYIVPEEQVGGTSGSLVYPYWCWKPCIVCQFRRPPRAHHCPVCNTCILKRDHHCFFIGRCVGVRNQRHFVVFCVWAVIMTCYCAIHACPYIYWYLLERISIYDLLLPITAINWLLGKMALLDFFFVCLMYSVTWFLVISFGFCVCQLGAIKRGLTSFEADTNIKVTSTASAWQNFRDVFGNYWALNFLLPVHWLFPPHEDGVTWSHIKP